MIMMMMMMMVVVVVIIITITITITINITITIIIKTITKFSNVIGYQQPDLSINWTVGTRHACNWTVRAILRALLPCTLLSKLLAFSAFTTTI